jgi:hypothetical protein
VRPNRQPDRFEYLADAHGAHAEAFANRRQRLALFVIRVHLSRSSTRLDAWAAPFEREARLPQDLCSSIGAQVERLADLRERRAAFVQAPHGPRAV